MVKTLKAALVLVGILGSLPASAAWDDPPLVNTVDPAANNLSLNFSSPGVHQQVALFVVNSNDAAGFHLTFTFANKGNFKVGTRQFPLLNVVLNAVSGTLGTGLASPANDPLVINPGTGIATWSSTGVPTSATDSYLIEIDADWADQSTGIAGFYLENITASIGSGP